MEIKDQGLFSPSIRLQLPILQGDLELSFGRLVEQQSQFELSNWGASLDTVQGENQLLLLSEVRAQGDISQSWDMQKIAYHLSLGDEFQIGLGIIHHQVGLQAQGSFAGESRFEARRQGTLIQGEYQGEQFAGAWSGSAKGDGWSPEACLRWGRLRGCSRFSAEFELTGPWQHTSRVPFYHSTDRLDRLLDNPDKLDSIETIDSLGSLQSNSSASNGRRNWTAQFPQIHLLEFELVPQTLALGYARILGQLSIEPQRDSLSDGRDALAWQFRPRHMGYIWLDLWHLRAQLGGVAAKTDPQESFSQGLSQLRAPNDAVDWMIIPIASLEWYATWHDWNWSLGWAYSPMPHLQLEVGHVW